MDKEYKGWLVSSNFWKRAIAIYGYNALIDGIIMLFIFLFIYAFTFV